GLGVVIAFIFGDFFIDVIILGPTNADFIVYDMLGIEAVDLVLQSRKLPGQFFTYWGTLIVIGGIIGCPILFYQLWAFIEPAMESGEKWKTRGHTLFITFFFLFGVAFGYFVLVPFALQFFSQFQISTSIHNDFDINEYFSSLTMWVLSCGIIFQLPVLSYFLSKFGLISQTIPVARDHILLCRIRLPDPARSGLPDISRYSTGPALSAFYMD